MTKNYEVQLFILHNNFVISLLCNVGLRHQNLSHLNKTHKKKTENKNETHLYSKRFIYINKTIGKVKLLRT